MKEYYRIELWNQEEFHADEVESEEEAIKMALDFWYKQKPCFKVFKLDPSNWE